MHLIAASPVLSHQGRYQEAEPLFLEALKIEEKILGSNHPNTVTFRQNLELLRQKQEGIWQKIRRWWRKD